MSQKAKGNHKITIKAALLDETNNHLKRLPPNLYRAITDIGFEFLIKFYQTFKGDLFIPEICLDNISFTNFCLKDNHLSSEVLINVFQDEAGKRYNYSFKAIWYDRNLTFEINDKSRLIINTPSLEDLSMDTNDENSDKKIETVVKNFIDSIKKIIISNWEDEKNKIQEAQKEEQKKISYLTRKIASLQ